MGMGADKQLSLVWSDECQGDETSRLREETTHSDSASPCAEAYIVVFG
jgi:hypothetical protein